MKSKIFDEYAKIAEEHGILYSEDELAKTASVKNADYADTRIGTDTEEVIRMLYDVKPNGEQDILDEAHPESVVISPAYDAMNGVVENLKERQNMMGYIATKLPTGVPTHRRYVYYDGKKYESPTDAYREASNELMGSLIRTGFSMDNQDEDELRKLADSCAVRIKKEALPVIAGIGIGLAALILAYTTYVNHFPPSQGFMNDLAQAIEELNDAMSEADPRTQNEIVSITKILIELQTTATNYANSENIPEPRNMRDLQAIRQNARSMSSMQSARSYINALQVVSGYLPNAIISMKNSVQQSESWGNWIAGLKNIKEFFVSSDVQDVAPHLETLQDSLSNELARVNAKMSQSQQHSEDVIKKLHQDGGSLGGLPMAQAPQQAPQAGGDVENLLNQLLRV